MDILQYENKINDIIFMSPIESGVQTLVYMLLDSIIEDKGYSLVVIDKLQQKSRFNSITGISDLAIVTKDFKYHDSEQGKCLGCVEVKNTDVSMVDIPSQVVGQFCTYGRQIYTNGLVWKFFDYKDIDCERLKSKINIINALNKQKKAVKKKARRKKINAAILKNENELQGLISCKWEINLKDISSSEERIHISKKRYEELLTELNKIVW